MAMMGVTLLKVINFAHAASLAVAESPGEVYNPLFLYGGVGLGKTHLMHSIAHFILENSTKKKVLYVTSETFTNELIDALKNGKTAGNESAMSKFRDKYRNNDVLLIDDIQLINLHFRSWSASYAAHIHLYASLVRSGMSCGQSLGIKRQIRRRNKRAVQYSSHGHIYMAVAVYSGGNENGTVGAAQKRSRF